MTTTSQVSSPSSSNELTRLVEELLRRTRLNDESIQSWIRERELSRQERVNTLHSTFVAPPDVGTISFYKMSQTHSLSEGSPLSSQDTDILDKKLEHSSDVNKTTPITIPTSAITIVESEHGRLRRMQRGIDKKDLQRAMKYGSRELQHTPTRGGDPISKYTYNDIVYIVNDTTHQEITSYAKPFTLDLVTVSDLQRKEHQKFEDRLQEDMGSWTSHLVLVVDTSGSMKAADVWGARTRLAAVWLTIALDIIAARIESGVAGVTDAVSVITLGMDPQVIIKEQPTTWLLYNEIATIYNEGTVQPYGHGPYLKSLVSARELLERNTCASCAMNLMFLSDGRPSSEHIRISRRWRVIQSSLEETEGFILNEIKSLARTFGRRLTFQAVGIGDFDEFTTLEKMVDEAKDYGVTAELLVPSMSTSSLGNVFSSVASSIISTQLELTNVLTMKQEQVKSIQRESRSEASKSLSYVSSGNNFFIYPASRFRRFVYTETQVELETPMGDKSSGKRWKTVKEYKEVPCQHHETRYIALAKEPFGEGAERFAFRFFEVGFDSGTILGKPMVAKESRFVMNQYDCNKYIETFCSTQQLSRRLATEFNCKLDKLRRVDPKTPRISFLDCSIYEIQESDGGRKKVLVEEKLDHNKWFKWNTNNGYVEGMQVDKTLGSPVDKTMGSHRELMQKVFSTKDHSTVTKDLDVIDEGDEEESEDDKAQDDNEMNLCLPVLFSPNEVAQAFSHFTYWASGRKRLVCDLQGVFDETTNRLLLSDPVIHYHNPYKEDRRFVHGRTDKGRKGFETFFASHKDYCGFLCKLLIRGLKPKSIRPKNTADDK